MESRVEGALIHLKQIVRTPVNPFGNGVTVEWARFERLQDEHVQSAWNQITGARFIEGFSSHKWLREVYLALGVDGDSAIKLEWNRLDYYLESELPVGSLKPPETLPWMKRYKAL